MQLVDDCCNKCEATRILGQLVHGVADDENRRKLLEVGDGLTLDDAVRIIRAAENAHQQASDLRGASSIQGISTPKSQKNRNHAKSNKPKEKTGSSSSKPGPKSSTDSDKEGCWNCGNKNRHPKWECPAKGQECAKCKRKGHFSRVFAQRAPKKQQSWLYSVEASWRQRSNRSNHERGACSASDHRTWCRREASNFKSRYRS